jgi:hypothetical protein
MASLAYTSTNALLPYHLPRITAPAVRSPTTTPRPRNCIARANTSEAEAELLLTSTTSFPV